MTFQDKILHRYEQNKRDLPRRDTFSVYPVLVSETMLQQTQVDRVIPKFNAFMKTFPTLKSLSEAPRELLLAHWSWLWFNSRAIRLQACATILLEQYQWILPKDRTTLLTLPGIWSYTSCSLLAFVYNLPAPVIDTNIRRIYIHELGIPENTGKEAFESIVLHHIPEWRSNDRHNALMDYGSTVLTSKKTGIKPLSKQSRFAWSRRQVRWNVLKHILKHWPTARTILEREYPHEEFDIALWQLLKEWLVYENKSIIYL